MYGSYVVTNKDSSNSDHKCTQETHLRCVLLMASVNICLGCPLVFGSLEMDVNIRCTQILYNSNVIMFSTVCISSFRAPGNSNLFIQLRGFGLVSLEQGSARKFGIGPKKKYSPLDGGPERSQRII